MNRDYDKTMEEALTEALESFEKGKPISEILDLFPTHKSELREIFDVVTILTKQKEYAQPSKELADRILAGIDTGSVTKGDEARFIQQGIPKGRPSPLPSIISINQQIMNIQWMFILSADMDSFDQLFQR